MNNSMAKRKPRLEIELLEDRTMPSSWLYMGPPGGIGCGSNGNSQYVPDRIGTLNLRPACDIHDQCWGAANQNYPGVVTNLAAKLICNYQFGSNIQQASGGNAWGRAVVSNVYVSAVNYSAAWGAVSQVAHNVSANFSAWAGQVSTYFVHR